MSTYEGKLRSIIRGLIWESLEEQNQEKPGQPFGERLYLNYGDIVQLKHDQMSKHWIRPHNPDFDLEAFVELDFKVYKVYPLDGDESDELMVFCDLNDDSGLAPIKKVPCYSRTLKVVKRAKQLASLKEGDIVILNDIPEDQAQRYFGKVKGGLQGLLGAYAKIIRIEPNRGFGGKIINQTRYAIVSPGEETRSKKFDYDENILFIVPLVEEFVSKLN
jgi:hypothetical protein